MDIQKEVELAAAEFAQRQRDWKKYAALPLDQLELVERTANLSIQERNGLHEYLVHHKRATLVRLKRRDNLADAMLRSALPVATTLFTVLFWVLLHFVSTAWLQLSLQVVSFGVAVFTWLRIQVVFTKAKADVQESIALLGPVD